MGLVWVGKVAKRSDGGKSNAHTVGLGLLYKSGAAAVVKGVGGTAERWCVRQCICLSALFSKK